MVKLNAKIIGQLIGRSPKYVYQLLMRKGISLKNIDYEKLIDLVAEYRHKTHIRKTTKGNRRIKLIHSPIEKQLARQKVDKTLYARLYEICKELAGGKCTICGREDYGTVHHIDCVHSNMILENLMFICWPCHSSLHNKTQTFVNKNKHDDFIRRYSKRSFKKYEFTMKDFAKVRGKTLHAVRKDHSRGKFDPTNLRSLVEYLSVVDNRQYNRRKSPSDHDRLVLRGERWLQQHCKVVIRDQCQAYTNNGENPDIIGWRDGLSVLIECKYSRADFLSDKQKIFRRHPEQGMGDWRFYMCPPGVIKVEDLPAGWGLLYVHPKQISKVHGFPSNTMWHHDRPFRGDKVSENQILVSALRRLAIRGHLEEIYKDMDEM